MLIRYDASLHAAGDVWAARDYVRFRDTCFLYRGYPSIGYSLFSKQNNLIFTLRIQYTISIHVEDISWWKYQIFSIFLKVNMNWSLPYLSRSWDPESWWWHIWIGCIGTCKRPHGHIETARKAASTCARPSSLSFSRFAHEDCCRGNLLCFSCQCDPFQRKVIFCHWKHVSSICHIKLFMHGL
jgi:hypothetical protein